MKMIIDIDEANEIFDNYIIGWVNAMHRLPYSEEERQEIWLTAQRDWLSMSENLYKFGLLSLGDKTMFENHAVCVTNKLIGNLVDTAYDMADDREMRRIYPYIKDDWKSFIGWTPELLKEI